MPEAPTSVPFAHTDPVDADILKISEASIAGLGHVVTGSEDAASPGSNDRVWATGKVPRGSSLEKHCALLARLTGADHFRVMPANRIFALGGRHVRRKGMEPGNKSDELAVVKDT